MKRSPLGTYMRAIKRYQRLRSRVDETIYRGTKRDQDRAFRVYFDNEQLINNLQNIMRQQGIEHFPMMGT